MSVGFPKKKANAEVVTDDVVTKIQIAVLIVDYVGRWHYNIYVFNSLSYLNLFSPCSFDDCSLDLLKYPIHREPLSPGDMLQLEQGRILGG